MMSRDRWTGLALILLLVAAAAWIYTPGAPRPFDIVDFAEFLPLLQEGSGPVDRFVRFVGFYAGDHGRLNLVAYAGLVLKWELFGGNVALWQWARFGELLLLTVLVHVACRRLHATPLGGAAGASLFLVARASGEGWTRVTLGEPLGLILFLVALLLAAGWRRDPSPRRGAGIALLVAGSILCKEMLVGLVPVLLATGLFRDAEGRFDPTQPPVRLRPFLAWTLVAAVVAFGASALTALASSGEGFTTMYGEGTTSVDRFLDLLQRPWQLQGQRGFPDSWSLPANTLVALLTLAGGAVAWRQGGAERRHLAVVGTLAAGVALAFAVLYLPWPFFRLYYGMPFLFGPALLLAAAVSACDRAGRWPRIAVLVGVLVVAVGAGTSSARAARAAIALQRTHGEVIDALAGRTDLDTVFVVRPQVGPLSWIGTGPSLGNFARATGRPAMPALLDRPCSTRTDTTAGGAPTSVVSYLNGCGPLGDASHLIRHPVDGWTLQWRGLRRGTDTIGADLRLPPPTAGR